MTSPTRNFGVSLIILHISTIAAKCFLPDGSEDDNDLPCFTNDNLSQCCSPNEFCSTNKLCVAVKSGGNKLSRGSCLDKGFGETCPIFCKGVKDSGKVEIYQCGDPKLGQFCCDEGKGLGSSCCSQASNIINLGVGTIFAKGASVAIMRSMSQSLALSTRASLPSQATIRTSQNTPQTIKSTMFSQTVPAIVLPSNTPPSHRSATFISLTTIKASLRTSLIPTTIPEAFTNLPSPVFTSIFVPKSTEIPQTTSRSMTRPSTTLMTTTPSSIASNISSLQTSQSTTTSNSALPINTPTDTAAPLSLVPKGTNSQAIIAGTVGGAVAVFLITFFVILFRQQQKRKSMQPTGSAYPKNFPTDEKGSIRSVQTNSSNQTAFGYKPEPKRNASERSDDQNISVPIVFRSETPYESIRSADIRSIEEQMQRMSGTTFRSVLVKTLDMRRMTPGSDFNVYQNPQVMSPTAMTDRSKSRDDLERLDRDSYVDERELATFGFTPEDLNKVGGTGYGQSTGNVVPPELEGMEGRIPDRLSKLSDRSATYQKLMYDMKSQPF